MSHIRSSKTKPELKFKKTLKTLGFAYQPKGIHGRPDFANKKHKIVIFIDGCFWHGCSQHYKKPKSNRDYWKNKIRKNMERDSKVRIELESKGWKVMRIWEHEIKKRDLD
jgi:DNA mismatch endonuclease (patch repair protein)